MKYSGIIKDDVANGLGLRTSLFVSGCRLKCPECFNKEAQDFEFGKEFTESVENDIFDSISDDYHAGISILGGEPLEPENAKRLFEMISRFRWDFGDNKNIWLFTGYTYEQIEELPYTDPRRALMRSVDVLVDGPFVKDRAELGLKFKGSSNQRIINMKESIKQDQVVLLEL